MNDFKSKNKEVFFNDFERFTVRRKERKREREKERVKVVQKFAVGIGVVAAVGIVTGILFAPKSGKQTREDLKKRCKRCRNHHGARP